MVGKEVKVNLKTGKIKTLPLNEKFIESLVDSVVEVGIASRKALNYLIPKLTPQQIENILFDLITTKQKLGKMEMEYLFEVKPCKKKN